ncbi:SDR family NAD(P)-dependent oxidoreductase [Streptomyces sp. NPDC058371]|uniref:SDR family NAD(P)-dependent oxidoreductase n=1 Tax=Streptomyces sp. NPDC058371 TaxID=3346463 RepID=UPI0036489D71
MSGPQQEPVGTGDVSGAQQETVATGDSSGSQQEAARTAVISGQEQETARTAVISGGSRGLGRLLVERLLADGWQVATFSRSANDFVKDTVAERPDHFIWESVDLVDRKALRTFVNSVARRFGGIDLLVNNAAVLNRQELFLTTSARQVDTLLASNLAAPIALAQACARVMSGSGGGQIINVSSINAVRGFRGVAVYSATKAGLDGFSRSLARELGPLNIRVNSIVPGFFDSDMTTEVTEQNRERIARRTPLGRLADVEEIANAVLFLASPQSSFITGQTLVVDGGITC